jgi:ABC-type nitrate/sulfonate/bicarbonate transport system substrate-binding protein
MSAANVTNLATVYLLETLGYAKDEGLDYSVKTALANALNLVVSGDGDLAAVGPSAALVPVREGKETSIIFALGSGTAVGFVAGTQKIKSIADCTRVSTSQAGTSTYSIAMTYKAATNANFNVLGLGDANQILPSVLSGGSDCAITALGLLQGGLDQGLHLVVDPRIPSTIPPNTIQDTIGSAFWGMKDNLQKKRSAVEKLMRAMKRVEQYVKTAPLADVAAALIRHEDFKAYKVDVLAKQIELEKLFWFPDGGYIRSASWPGSLRFFQYGLPFIDPANKIYSWDSRVDMSYWVSVNGQPARK